MASRKQALAIGLTTKPKPVIELGDTDPKLLAEAIVSVAASAKKLLGAGLTKECLCLLIQHKCGGPNAISRTDIAKVLDAAADLGSLVVRR
jgi:hypothetical protein